MTKYIGHIKALFRVAAIPTEEGREARLAIALTFALVIFLIGSILIHG